MATNLTKKVVKVKKLQKVGENSLSVIVPLKWIEEMGWNQNTKLVLEFLPHRKMMILSEDVIGTIGGEKVHITDEVPDPNDPNLSIINNGKKDNSFNPV